MDRFPKPSKPRPVKGGGIRVQAARGTIGERWWSRRWVEALERLAIASRLERGRRYARKGQVALLEVTGDGVRAKVQGSRVRPYEVAIRLRSLDEAARARVLDAMAAQARFAASLLAGEVPPDIEKAFGPAGVSLFPVREEELETACSCPDWENPCKHVAAVHYVLAEALDRDPFLLFHLRGLAREAILEGLRARRAEAPPSAAGEAMREASLVAREPERPFWILAAVAPVPVSIAAPREEVMLLKALGLPPVWASSRADPHGLVEAYRRATDWGLRLAFGEDDDQPPGRVRPVGVRTVAPDGRIRAAAEKWYAGREFAGRRVEVCEAAEGLLFLRVPDGSLRRLERPARFAQMPPEG